MLVGEGIIDVLAFTTAHDEPLVTQDPQALGDGWEFSRHRDRQLGHTRLTLSQEREEAQALDITDGSKDACGSLDGKIPHRLGTTVAMIMMMLLMPRHCVSSFARVLEYCQYITLPLSLVNEVSPCQ
jgi:hypothetical protein